ncbi:MAG: ATP-binding protein [Spirochaetes bacterium]|nr:ATP-binding protein [Spirochaetota bacterium]
MIRWPAYLILGALLVLMGSVLFAGPVADLNARDLYVRSGFSPQWTDSLPDPADAGWMRVPPGRQGKRTVKVPELGLKDVHSRGFLSPASHPDREFTFVTSFLLDGNDLATDRILGIHLAAIGGNWEIYINGHLIRREMHRCPDGAIAVWKAMRDVHAPIDPRLLRAGENIAAFRIVGDPAYGDTGFYQSTPYIIDDYPEILDLNSETVPLILIFIYLFMGLYHLLLYAYQRQERYNLFYGLFSVGLFVYLFARTHTVYSLMDDTEVILRVELFTLFLLIPLIGSFFDLILYKKLHPFTKGYAAFTVLLSLLVLATPKPFALDVLRIWQLTSLVPISFYLFYRIGFAFYRDLRAAARDYAGRGESLAALKGLAATIGKSVSGNLLAGVLVLCATTVFDIIDALYLNMDLVLTRYGFFLFMGGTAFVLANRFFTLHGRVRSLNEILEQKIEDLDRANRAITVSQERYRILIEGTDDGIFSLDEQWRFVTANGTLMNEFGTGLEDLVTKRLHDFIYEGPEDMGVTLQMVQQRLDEFARTKRPVTMKVKLRSHIASEPREWHLRLEHIGSEGRLEILGKASRILEDALLENFRSERQRYVIGNYLVTAEELSQRLVRNLVKYVDQRAVNLLRIGLREMIINAIEHGNLNISFDEKTEATMDDGYLDFISRRREDPRYRNRTITVEYSLTAERVVYSIMDEGEGFDHRKVMMGLRERANGEMLAHGRGITMAANLFDEIRFNRRGNQVLLTKRFGADN